MSEEQAERLVCHLTDKVDARYLRGELSESEYAAELRAIDRRAAALARKVGV